MPHSLFLLSRLFVRVDHVLFRIYDVRMYHAFDTDEVVRECSGLEADYDEVKRYLEKPTELSPLTDPNWVYGVLQKIASKRRDSAGAAGGEEATARSAASSPAVLSTSAGSTAAPWATASSPQSTQAPWAKPAGTTPTPARGTPASPSRPTLPHSSSSSSRRGKPWPGLGRRVHVLRLPSGGLTGVQAGLRSLNLEA